LVQAEWRRMPESRIVESQVTWDIVLGVTPQERDH
jgi:hypothetical protein